MIEKIIKAIKRGNKKRGRNITIGTVIGLLLSCAAVMKADDIEKGHEIANKNDPEYDFINNEDISVSNPDGNAAGLFVISSTMRNILNNKSINVTGGNICGIFINSSAIEEDIVNNGTINTTGTTKSYGIVIGNSSTVRDIINNGTINAVGTDGAYGINIDSNVEVRDIVNNGSINVISNERSVGISAFDIAVGDLINNGSINAFGSREVNGVYIERNSAVEDIVNTGIINAVTTSNTDYSYGINIRDSSAEDIINTGNISAVSTKNGYGIYLNSSSTVEDIINNGSITGAGDDSGSGINLSNSSIEGYITNSGSIIGAGAANFGYGISLSNSSIERYITNSGSITGVGIAYSYGIDLNGSTIGGEITNNGSITGTGSNNSNYGIDLNGSTIGGDITNSGNITSNGTGSYNSSYGMYLIGPSINIINSGIISGRGSAGSAGYGIEARPYGDKGNINNLGVVFGSISAVNGDNTVNNYGILIVEGNSVVDGTTATNYGLEISDTDGKVSEAAQNLTDPIVIGHDAERNEIKRNMTIKNAALNGSSGSATSTTSIELGSNNYNNHILNGKNETLKVTGAGREIKGSVINAYGTAVLFDGINAELTLSGTVVNGGIDGSSIVMGSDNGDKLTLQSEEIEYVDGSKRIHNTVINGAIEMGMGDDTLAVGTGSIINGKIDMGAGKDILTIADKGIINGDIDMGMGDDTLTVGTGSTINGKIDMGAGEDILTIADKGIINGDIDMGMGDDTFTVGTESIINGKIDMGAGKDILTIADKGIINGDIDMGMGDDTLTVGTGSIINGKIDMGAGDDTLTIETGSIINGTLHGGADNDILNFNSPVARSLNIGEINILHNISGFENMNINTNVTLFETTVDNDGNSTGLKVTDAGNITIGANGVLTLRIDTNKIDSSSGTDKITGHALYENNGIISSTGGKLLLALNGAGKDSIISFGDTRLGDGLVTEDEALYQEDVTFDTTSILHSVGKIDSATNEIRVTAKADLPTKPEEPIDPEDPIEPEDPTKSVIPDDVTYKKLNKIYHGIRSLEVNGLENFNVDDYEKLSLFLEYLNDIYAGNPYSYSSELSRKSMGMFRDIVTENIFRPETNKWMIYGGLTHIDGGTKDTYYGRGYYTYDMGSSNVEADTKITGAYMLGEYGISDTLTAGVVIGGNKLKSDLSNNSKVDGDALYMGAYVKKYVGNLKVTAGAGFQYGDYDIDRIAVNKVASDETKAVMKYSDNYNDISYDIYLNGRYSNPIGDNLFLEPYGTLSYTYIDQDGADEGNKTLAIETDSKLFDYTTAKVGVDLKKVIPHEKGKSTLTAGVSYTRILSGADEESITGRFKGGSDFDILVAHKNEHSIGLNAKYTLELESGMLFDLKGTYAVERDSHNGTGKNKTKGEWIVGAGLGYKF